MIQVEERQRVASPDPPPARNPIVLSLMAIAGLTLVIGLLPWERFCTFRGGLSLEPATPLCFSARIWSGSASLFGLLAMVLAAVFLGTSLTRRWYRKDSVGTGCLVLATGFVTALAIKVVVVLVDSGLYHRAQSTTYQPQSVGVWLGLIIAVTATIALVFAFAGPDGLPACVVVRRSDDPHTQRRWSGLRVVRTGMVGRPTRAAVVSRRRQC